MFGAAAAAAAGSAGTAAQAGPGSLAARTVTSLAADRTDPWKAASAEGLPSRRAGWASEAETAEMRSSQAFGERTGDHRSAL